MTHIEDKTKTDHFILTEPDITTPPSARCRWRIFIQPDDQPVAKTLRPWLMPRPLPTRRA